MAAHDDDDGLTLAIPERRPRALKDIGYNSLIYDTSNTSSGEDLSDIEGGIPLQDARRVFDVSLGPEQSRLTSPKTPAPEKAAVIEAAGGFFGDGADDTQRDLAEEEGEDDDVLEVPVYVRVEWTADAHVNADKSAENVPKEPRELGYWCVLGLGRISD